MKVRNKNKSTDSILSFLIAYFLNFPLLSLFSVSFPQLMLLFLVHFPSAVCWWLQWHRCCTLSFSENSVPKLLWEYTAQRGRGLLIETASLCCTKAEDELFQCGRWRWFFYSNCLHFWTSSRELKRSGESCMAQRAAIHFVSAEWRHVINIVLLI